MNVVVLVPVGLLLSCVSYRLKWWLVLLIGFSISVSIEALQFFFIKDSRKLMMYFITH